MLDNFSGWSKFALRKPWRLSVAFNKAKWWSPHLSMLVHLSVLLQWRAPGLFPLCVTCCLRSIKRSIWTNNLWKGKQIAQRCCFPRNQKVIFPFETIILNWKTLLSTTRVHLQPPLGAPWEFHLSEKCDLCLVCFFSSVPNYRKTLLYTGSISRLPSCRWKEYSFVDSGSKLVQFNSLVRTFSVIVICPQFSSCVSAAAQQMKSRHLVSALTLLMTDGRREMRGLM